MIDEFRVKPRTDINRVVVDLHPRSYASGDHEDPLAVVLADVVTDDAPPRAVSLLLVGIDEQHETALVIVAVVVLHDAVRRVKVDVESNTVVIPFERLRIAGLVELDDALLTPRAQIAAAPLKPSSSRHEPHPSARLYSISDPLHPVGQDTVGIDLADRIAADDHIRTRLRVASPDEIPDDNTRAPHTLDLVALDQDVVDFSSAT